MLTTKEIYEKRMTEIKQKISKLIDSDKVVLFMKGTPTFLNVVFPLKLLIYLTILG